MRQDGQLVTFAEVIGMTELNDGKPRRIRNCKARMQLVQKQPTLRPPVVSATISCVYHYHTSEWWMLQVT